MKYFRMSYEEVVFRRSYINVILLNRSIPSFKIDKEKDGVGRKPRSSKDRKVETPIKQRINASDFFSQFM